MQHQRRRNDEATRAQEQATNTEQRQQRRNDEATRAQEQTANTGQHQRRRTDEATRAQEQATNTEQRQQRRNDEATRAQEQAANTEQHEARRTFNVEFRRQERIRDRVRRHEQRNSEQAVLEKYEQGIRQGPSLVCVCCGCLFFKRSCRIFDRAHLESTYGLSPAYLNRLLQVEVRDEETGNLFICISCHKYVKSI